MLAFARAYPQPSDFSPQPVAKLQGTSSSPQARATRKVPQAVAHTPATPSSPQPVAKSPGDSLLWQVPWGHHALLLAKVKPLPARRWYIEQALAQGWSRNTLMLMIDSAAHTRQGARASNGKVHTRGVWVYDLRTNKHFSLKTRPLKTDDLQDFVACYRPDNRHQRQESERFRYFDYETLVARDKASLDVFWLKDSSLENLDDLPPPDVLQQEIIDHLEAALSAFRDVAAGLPKTAAT